MNEIPRLLLLLVGTYLVHSTLLLGGLWALLRVFRGNDPRVVESFWKLAALAPLVTIPVQLLAGTSAYRFGVPDRDGLAREQDRSAERQVAVPVDRDHNEPIALLEPADVSSRLPAVSTVHDDLVPDHAQALSRAPLRSPSDREEGRGSAERPSVVARPVTGSQESARRPLEALSAWIPWTTLCALLVGALGVFRFALVSHRFHHWLLRCEEYQGSAHGLLDELLDRARLRRGRVRLLTSEKEREPAALGIHRWRIVLPAGIDRWLSREDLAAVLAHELAHLVRRDPVWQNVGRLLCGCAAFQPLNFVAWRSWRRAAEVQCDSWAVRHGADRLALARGLTLMAERRNQGQLTGVLRPAIGSTGNLSERVERLLEPRPLETCPRWSDSTPVRLLMFGSVLAACCFLLPGIRLGGVTPPAAAEEPIAAEAGIELSPHAVREDEDPHQSGLQLLMRQLAALDQDVASLGAEIRALQRNPRAADPSGPAWKLMSRLTSHWENLKRRRDALSQLALQIDHNRRKP